MDDVLLNPVEIGNKLLEASNSAGKSVVPVSEAYDAYKTAELDFKKQYAIKFREAKGSVEDRKQLAIEETHELAEILKDAEVIYKRMLDYQRSYRDKTSVFQTLLKSVDVAYQAAGVGR